MTRREAAEKTRPVIKPMIGDKRLVMVPTRPKSETTKSTAEEKKAPLVPAQSISPIRISFGIRGAASMLSYVLS